MINCLPEELIELAKACPFPLYVVGGRVRDFLAGLVTEGSDIDICAPSPAENFANIARSLGFKVDAVYKKTGTVKISKKSSYEFASFRSDKYVRGEHTPASTYFTDDIILDAKRRDFKCNAVYFDICAGQFKDPLGGIGQIKAKIMSAADNPEKVFGEDGLRLMRLARIAAETGFSPDESTLSAAKEKCALISDVSVERVWGELKLILRADKKYGVGGAHLRGLEILKDIGVLKIILPELCAGEGIRQRSDFHKYDVLEHSLKCFYYAPEEVRFAALLHDVGKPACFLQNGNFFGHEERGAEIAAEICARLKLPKKFSEETVRLVKTHMYDFRGDARECKIRRFIVANFDILDKILMIKQADFSACADDLSPAPSVVKINKIYKKMRDEGAPFCLKDLNIRGDELKNLNIPAQSTGKILNTLLSECAEGMIKNCPEKLKERAQKLAEKI